MLANVLKRYKKLPGFVPANFESLSGAASDLVVFAEGRKKTFYHSGDFGDIIYALPAIRALGGGKLYIGPEFKLPFSVTVRQTFTKEITEIVAPLLRLQPYLDGVEFVETMPEVDFDMNRFRELLNGPTADQDARRLNATRSLNLAEKHLLAFRLPLDECNREWLIVDRAIRLPEQPVLIHRSARWRNEDFPWRKVLAIHGFRAAFVGLESEYRAFVADFDAELPFIKTTDFLELARYIAGSSLYIGNQSAPYAVAEGLKKSTLQETWPEGPNCIFVRSNAYYGSGKIVYVPKLQPTMTKETIPCPLCGSDASEPARANRDIVRCSTCSVVYLKNRPTKESMEIRYQTYADGASHMRLPVTVDEINTTGLRREYFMTDLLEHAYKPGGLLGGLLDVGCGWGAFLLNGRNKGFQSVAGIEIGHKSANFAATVLGLPVKAVQLEDAGYVDAQFNVVTMIHTLEHLPNQVTALKTVHRILGAQGLFCGIVPNFDSFCSRKLKDKWPWLDPGMHYTYFTRDTLKHHLETNGFEMVEMHTKTGDYSLEEIVKLIRDESNVPMSNEEVGVRLEQLWVDGLGEEIRFFARKV